MNKIFYFFILFSLNSYSQVENLDTLTKTDAEKQKDIAISQAENALNKSLEFRACMQNAANENNKCISQVPTPPTCQAENTARKQKCSVTLDNIPPSVTETANACLKLSQINNAACTGQTYLPYITGMLGLFKSSSGAAENLKAKCESAAKFNKIWGGINIAIAGTCHFTSNSCVESCTQAAELLQKTIDQLGSTSAEAEALAEKIESIVASTSEKRNGFEARAESCGKSEINVMSALVSGAQFIQGFQQADNCANIIDDECAQSTAYNNPSCTSQYCSNPSNAAQPQCRALASSCASGDSKYSQVCACISNPSQQGCPGYYSSNSNKLNPSLSDANERFNTDALGTGVQDTGLKGPIKPEGAGPNIKEAGNKGGAMGAAGGAGAGSGAGGDGSPREEPGPYDTNVIGGAGGGSGSSGGSSAGYESGSSSSFGKTTSSGGTPYSGFDLKQYLPGGAKAANRGPTSLESKSISTANGLTNFQKVDQTINSNRRALPENQ